MFEATRAKISAEQQVVQLKGELFSNNSFTDSDERKVNKKDVLLQKAENVELAEQLRASMDNSDMSKQIEELQQSLPLSSLSLSLSLFSHKVLFCFV